MQKGSGQFSIGYINNGKSDEEQYSTASLCISRKILAGADLIERPLNYQIFIL